MCVPGICNPSAKEIGEGEPLASKRPPSPLKRESHRCPLRNTSRGCPLISVCTHTYASKCQRKLRKIINNVSKQPGELCTGQSVRSWCSPESGHLSPWHRDGVFLYDKATLPALETITLERFSLCGQDSNTCLRKRAHSPPLLPSQILSSLERPTIGPHEGICWSWSLPIYPVLPSLPYNKSCHPTVGPEVFCLEVFCSSHSMWQ